ncbi:MAG: hypothetical protein ACKV19_02940 [Verrucomicrobiales bacterium]
MIVFFAWLAILNLTNRVAVVPSVLWLAIVASIVWNGCREAGGISRYLTDLLADFAGRHFVIHSVDLHPPSRIRFGYELLGRRFYQLEVDIARIESVEWSPGQATSLAGRDMQDWSVVLWFDHGDPEKSKKDRTVRKPNRSLHVVGPARPQEVTAAFAMEFVHFLQNAGARLTQSPSENAFVREGPAPPPATTE